MSEPNATARLASLAAGMPTAEVPEVARHAATRMTLNVVALATGAVQHPASVAVREALATFEGGTEGAVLGSPALLPALWAALANGFAAHVEDYDDTHLRSVIHPGAPIVPAALATGEMVNATGSEILAAVALGAEVAIRVANGMGRSHFDRGWHVTGTMGRLGAAVAAGRLLGLDAAGMTTALGIASTQASGLQAALGTMAKPFHPGKAAADGIESALLAQHGFTAPSQPLEGRRGMGHLMSADPDYAAMTDGLGDEWEVVDNAIKPYACGIVSHAVIDAGIAAREALGTDQALAGVQLRVNPVVLDVMGVTDPENGLQSKFSVYHCFAVGYLDGRGGPEQFSDASAIDPAVRELRARIEVRTDERVRRDEAWATVAPRDGEAWSCHIEHATASAANPMTDEALTEKARRLMEPVLGAGASDVIEQWWRLAEHDRIAPLLAATTPSDAHSAA